MTHERLHQLLENPALLAGMPYEELKTLALSYPYAHNLRYLLALKSHQEHRPDAQRTLTTASVYSLSRSRLYTLIAPQKIVQHEEILELKPIETLTKTVETRVPVSRLAEEAEIQQFLTNHTTALPEPPKIQPVQEIVVSEKPEKTWIQFPPVTSKPSFGVWISQFNPVQLAGSGQRAAGSAVEVPKVFENTPVHVSTSPKSVDEAPEALGEDPMRPEDVEAKKANDAAHVAQRLAERSVQENKEIASETLARLYWRQGHKEKALAMYERLCLLFPEKSDYFASEIDKLKK